MDVDVKRLWSLSPEQFNQWRRDNDYPIIYKHVSEVLPFFQEWQEKTGVTRTLMFEFGIGRFLASKGKLSLFHYHGGDRYVWLTEDPGIAHLRDPRNTYQEDVFLPYFKWLRMEKGEERFEQASSEFRVSCYVGNKPLFFNKFFLLLLGGITLQQPNISGRLLDFVCLDGLHIIDASNSTKTYIWYSTAKSVRVAGGVWHLNFYKTTICDFDVKTSLLLYDGVFGGWEIDDERLRFSLVRGVFRDSKLCCASLEFTSEFSEILDVDFEYTKIIGRSLMDEVKFNRKVKLLHSAQGDHFNAGKQFYKEKVSQLRYLASPFYEMRFLARRPKGLQIAPYLLRNYLAFICEFIAFSVWGYGEKPGRSLIMSIAVIMFCTMTYFFGAGSVTNGDVIKSLYFSLVTFATLGYGDVSQVSSFYRLFSAVEAFLGVVLMGLFLAGLASKSKQY